MEKDEKMLPLGEPTLHFYPPPMFEGVGAPTKSAGATPRASASSPNRSLPGVPSPKQQQWGVLISIVIIVLMIIIGAFYSWGKRIAQEQAPVIPSTSSQ